jgi:ATP-dependent exoDNAse (exonuclease V) alpha subunit
MELQIVVPMKIRGELCCYNINTKIQEIYNPKVNSGNYIEIFVGKNKDDIKKYNIRVDDKVINVKNNYKCVNSEGVTTPVFNGNIGIVKEITDDGYCTVDFVGLGEIVLNKEETKSLELAYAVTIHKSQGSGFNTTIVGLDSGSYILNNSELLYTALTRAKKYCILVGNDYAIQTAIGKNEVKTKQTFLKELLQLKQPPEK